MVICFPKKGLVGKCSVYGTLTNGSQKKKFKRTNQKTCHELPSSFAKLVVL